MSLKLIISSLLIGFVTNSALAIDCNNNGSLDSTDITNSTSQDCNNNSIPDECDVTPGGVSWGSRINLNLTAPNLGGSLTSATPSHVADFNGDGKGDLWGSVSYSSLTNATLNKIFIYINQGANTFGAPLEYDFDGSVSLPVTSGIGTAKKLSDIFTYDIDSDNDLDIVFREDRYSYSPSLQAYYVDIKVLKNNGTGSFTEATITTTVTLKPPTSFSNTTKLIPANLSNATSKDLFLIHEGELLALYNQGNLHFQIINMGPDSNQVGNKGADNLTFVADESKSIVIYAYNQKEMIANIYGNENTSLSRSNNITYTLGAKDIVSKLKNKGANYGYTLYNLVPALPDDTYLSENPYSAVVAVTSSIPNRFTATKVGKIRKFQPVADFDKDGAEDLILFGDSGSQILINKGDNSGEISARVNLFLEGSNPVGLALYDFNSDGKLDILYKQSGASINIALNQSTYPLIEAVSIDQNANTIPDSCERATPLDFDGDKQSDRTVVRNYSGQLLWLTRNSTANSYGESVNTPLGSLGDILLAGDFDGDGKVNPGTVSSFQGSLKWTYALDNLNSVVVYNFGLAGDTPLTGHFNSDRKLDRVVVRNFLGNLQWHINTEFTDPTSYTSYLFGLTGDTPFTGDIDGDGIDELIVSRTSPSGQIVWYGLKLSNSTVFGPIDWGLKGDKLLPPLDVDGNGNVDLLVSRTIGAFKFTFSRNPYPQNSISSVDSTMTLFGLTGDEIYFEHQMKVPFAQLAVRRYESSSLSSIYNRIGQSDTYDYFGFLSDTLIGPDGKSVSNGLNKGALQCDNLIERIGLADYDPLWDPNPRGKPKYFVSKINHSLYKSVSILSAEGVLLDTMSKKSRNSNQFNGRKKTVKQLIKSGGRPLYVQIERIDGRTECDSLLTPEIAQ